MSLFFEPIVCAEFVQNYFYGFIYLLEYHSVLHGIMAPDRNLHLDVDISQACSYEEAVQTHDGLGHGDCDDYGDLHGLDGEDNYQLEENAPVGKDTREEMAEKVLVQVTLLQRKGGLQAEH